MEALSVPILRYNKETDEMVLSFPKIISKGKKHKFSWKRIYNTNY